MRRTTKRRLSARAEGLRKWIRFHEFDLEVVPSSRRSAFVSKGGGRRSAIEVVVSS